MAETPQKVSECEYNCFLFDIFSPSSTLTEDFDSLLLFIYCCDLFKEEICSIYQSMKYGCLWRRGEIRTSPLKATWFFKPAQTGF